MQFRIVVESQGCSANFGEGELIAGLLREQGHTLQSENPQIAVLNLCTVKGNGSALKVIRETQEKNPGIPLVVTGCVTADLVRDIRRLPGLISVASTNSLQHLPKVVAETLEGKRTEDLSRIREPKLGIQRIRRNPVVGIVPVSNGCLDHCTFCSTRLVKGRHYSFPAETIISEVEALIADGCQEIWLTGQDAGCYGFDHGTNLAKLCHTLLDRVKQDFRLRVGMGNPRHILSYWEDLVSIYQDPRVFRFIHLPVQAGSDSVLQRMGRRHSADDFRMLADALRSKVSDLTLSTDIIVGFPGESDTDFQATLDLLDATKPAVMNTTRFVVRPGTAAAKMKEQVHRDIKKERSSRLFETVSRLSLANNMLFEGQTQSLLIDDHGKPGTSIAHTNQYKPVILVGDYPLGTRLKAEITKAEVFSLRGEVSGLTL